MNILSIIIPKIYLLSVGKLKWSASKLNISTQVLLMKTFLEACLLTWKPVLLHSFPMEKVYLYNEQHFHQLKYMMPSMKVCSSVHHFPTENEYLQNEQHFHQLYYMRPYMKACSPVHHFPIEKVYLSNEQHSHQL